MNPSEMDGIFLCGEFKRVEQVVYGANHATKPGQPVAGMFRLVLGVGPGMRFEQTASFNEMDLATHAESVVSQAVGDGSALVGRRVYVRVALRGNKQGYANMEALNVYVIDGRDVA